MAWWLDILQILFPDLVNKGTRLGFIIYLFKDKETGWERLSDLPKVTQLVCKVAGLRVLPKTVTLQTLPLLSWASRHLEAEHRCFASSFTHQPLTNLAVSGIGVGVENKAAESWEGSSRRRGIVPHFSHSVVGKEWSIDLLTSPAIFLANDGRDIAASFLEYLLISRNQFQKNLLQTSNFIVKGLRPIIALVK